MAYISLRTARRIKRSLFGAGGVPRYRNPRMELQELKQQASKKKIPHPRRRKPKPMGIPPVKIR